MFALINVLDTIYDISIYEILWLYVSDSVALWHAMTTRDKIYGSSWNKYLSFLLQSFETQSFKVSVDWSDKSTLQRTLVGSYRSEHVRPCICCWGCQPFTAPWSNTDSEETGGLRSPERALEGDCGVHLYICSAGWTQCQLTRLTRVTIITMTFIIYISPYHLFNIYIILLYTTIISTSMYNAPLVQ